MILTTCKNLSILCCYTLSVSLHRLSKLRIVTCSQKLFINNNFLNVFSLNILNCKTMLGLILCFLCSAIWILAHVIQWDIPVISQFTHNNDVIHIYTRTVFVFPNSKQKKRMCLYPRMPINHYTVTETSCNED